MYFHVYSFKLQIHAHIYRSFIRHHKMLGVRIAKRKTSLKSRAKANPCGTKLRACIFFGADKFASQTYPAGELKSRGNPAKVSPATSLSLRTTGNVASFLSTQSRLKQDIHSDVLFFVTHRYTPRQHSPHDFHAPPHTTPATRRRPLPPRRWAGLQ